MNPEDPFRGLPSLNRLESDLERSERHLSKGWASRHMRLIAGAGAILAAGFVVSPVGPAIGGDDSGEEVAGQPVHCTGIPVAKLPALPSERPGARGPLEGEALDGTFSIKYCDGVPTIEPAGTTGPVGPRGRPSTGFIKVEPGREFVRSIPTDEPVRAERPAQR